MLDVQVNVSYCLSLCGVQIRKHRFKDVSKELCLKKCHIHTDTDVLESQNGAIQIDTERSGYCKCVLAEHRRSTAPQTILLLSPSGISICGRIYGTDVGLFRHLEIEKMESHPWSQGTSEDFCVCVINVRVPFTCSYGHYFWDERWDPCGIQINMLHTKLSISIFTFLVK